MPPVQDLNLAGTCTTIKLMQHLSVADMHTTFCLRPGAFVLVSTMNPTGLDRDLLPLPLSMSLLFYYPGRPSVVSLLFPHSS